MEISEYSILRFIDLVRIRKHQDFLGSPAINIQNLIGSSDHLGFGCLSKPSQETFLRDMSPGHNIQIQIDVPARSEGGFGPKVSSWAYLNGGVSCNIGSWTLDLFQMDTVFLMLILG